jgi:acyl carrier protein
MSAPENLLPILQAYMIDDLAADPADVEQIDLRLIEEDIIDSLGIFSMVEFIDDRFDIEIDPEEITVENFGTLRSIEALVRRKLDE